MSPLLLLRVEGVAGSGFEERYEEMPPVSLEVLGFQ
jgi:hypothetical protein